MTTGRDNIVGDALVDTLLTNYSETFIQDASAYISNAAATIIPVQAQAGSFRKYPRSYFLRDEMAPRPHGGAPVQVRYSMEKGTYVVDEYAAEHYIDDRDRARSAINSDNLDLNATRLLTTKALIRRDRSWAETFFKAGVWSTERTGIASGTPTEGQFLRWDQAASNPIGDVLTAVDAVAASSSRRPNVGVFGANVITALRMNPAIQDLIKYTAGGVPTEDLIAQMFGLDKIVVARSVYNAAPERAGVDVEDATSIQYIVNADSVWIGYVEPFAGSDAPTAVASFVWTGLEGGLANAQGGVIRRGRDDRARSDWFQIIDAQQFQIMSPDLGVFFNGAVGA